MAGGMRARIFCMNMYGFLIKSDLSSEFGFYVIFFLRECIAMGWLCVCCCCFFFF